ncbi:MAG TPA: DUF1003 domain-containing protein [Longimicrobium sp.]|nr:DUF1003 domain-containing protein [Longimicrobium sp.]
MSPARRRHARAHPRGVESEQRRHAREVAADHRVEAVKVRFAAERTPVERFSDHLMAIAASTPFLLAHAVWFILWIGWNVTRPRAAFDPFPFGLLTMVVSLEAIFLSIFVLLSQRRESQIAELREEMTLEVQMRTEEEVTKVLQLVAGLYGRLGYSVASDDRELREMLRPLDKASLEEELSDQIRDDTRAAPDEEQAGDRTAARHESASASSRPRR